MPAFRDATVSQAPPEEVWKLLYDPARFPGWWAGIAAVEMEEPREGEPGRFDYHRENEPDVPMPSCSTPRATTAVSWSRAWSTTFATSGA